MSGGRSEDDLYQELQDLIQEETLYLRHYNARVTNIVDPLKLGRVQVIIEDLGFYTPAQGIWAHPRIQNGLTLPKLNDYVDVYFMNGDSGKPVYLCLSYEMRDLIPTKWQGIATDAVIYEQRSNAQMNIKAETGVMKFMNGTESVVLGDTLKTELQKNVDALTQLQSDFNSWTPVPNDGGQALKTLLSSGFLTNAIASLTNILSILMKIA